MSLYSININFTNNFPPIHTKIVVCLPLYVDIFLFSYTTSCINFFFIHINFFLTLKLPQKIGANYHACYK